MKYYRLWAMAFLLKFAGSSWDASYHFKYLFEEYSIPHLVNFAGFLLGAVLLIKEWRKSKHLERLSRNIISVGYVLFLIGIPLDFSYHIAFGIDLTTWSPTHFIYYIGTGMMIMGVWRSYTLCTNQTNLSWRSLHTWFGMFMIECLIFPCMQQENGAISYWQYIHRQSIASKEILDLISEPSSQIFGGVPSYVYPIYTFIVLTLFTMITNKILRNGKIAIAATAFYLVCRILAKGIYELVNYPTSYIPLTILIIPIVFFILRKSSVSASVTGAMGYYFILYLFQKMNIFITPPLHILESIPIIILSVITPMIFNFFMFGKEVKPLKNIKKLS